MYPVMNCWHTAAFVYMCRSISSMNGMMKLQNFITYLHYNIKTVL